VDIMADPSARGSLDPGEIEKFSALAARWWDPEGPFGALHRMNPVRLGYIREQAARRFRASGPRPLKGLSALDIGCGGGLVSEPLARLGAEVTGLDGSEEAIAAASAHAQAAGLNIDYRTGTAEALAARGETFDLVTALEIIEHVADVPIFLAAAAALVKPAGTLIVSTINRTQKAWTLAIFGAERVLKWAPEGAHDYDKLVTPDEIISGASALHWQAPVGISFNPLGQGWSLSRDVSINYLMAGDRAS
jgi:2-polyprenyl-6-hydroxyphenyl methylase/3-demethylubiquinone-9 3-methyltransferase